MGFTVKRGLWVFGVLVWGLNQLGKGFGGYSVAELCKHGNGRVGHISRMSTSPVWACGALGLWVLKL